MKPPTHEALDVILHGAGEAAHEHVNQVVRLATNFRIEFERLVLRVKLIPPGMQPNDVVSQLRIVADLEYELFGDCDYTDRVSLASGIELDDEV